LSLSLEKDNKSLLNKSNWYWYVILGLFIYLIIITIRAYSYTKIKWFIDLKYISSTKLLIYIGFIGILISTNSCVIETNIKCSNKNNFCEINEKNNNTYLDNFYIYYDKVSEIKKRDEIIYETCVILFGMISKFFAIYFDMMIIKNLTPVHFIFYSSIYYFIIKIISYFFKRSGEFDGVKFCKFILDISGNFIAIFGFLIYLEIIELTQSIGSDSFNEEDEQSEKNNNSKTSELESNPL